MKIYLISLIFSLSIAQAELINAIAFIVNDDPITLYDIDKKMETQKLSKDKAVGTLIDEILYTQLLTKYNISVDIFDVDDYIEKLAKSNKMSLFEFKNAVKQQQNYEQFKNQIKSQLKHQKLISKIAFNKIVIAVDDDLKIYYNNNQSQFKIASIIKVIQYKSKDKKALLQIKKNPMAIAKNVTVKEVHLKQNDLKSQTKFIINKTNEKKFTAIFASDKFYNMFYILEKLDIDEIQFEDVKSKIFGIIMKQREQEYLKNYFEILKLTADIKVLRQ